MNEYTQRKIIAWTFAVVLILGAIEVKMFLLPPSTVAKAIAMAHRARQPASVSMGEESNSLIDVADEILDFQMPCEVAKNTVDASTSKQLRVHFDQEECDDVKITEITNETNSYQGTLFDLSETSQTSDFIQLKEGPNHIKIKLVNSKHQKTEQEYIFTRTLARAQTH